MSDEVAIQLISLASTVVTGISAAVTVLARRVSQNTVAVAAMSAKLDTLIEALAKGSTK